MEWENEFKKRLLKIIQEHDPDVDPENIHIVGIDFPDIEDLESFEPLDLGRIYAFCIMREDYEQAKKVKEVFDKKGYSIDLDIDEKNKTGMLKITPIKSLEKIEINMKVLKDGLSIDWDKEI